MLLSMTGFGEARLQDPRWTIAVEMRTVNNRHFKMSAKISDSHAMVEAALHTPTAVPGSPTRAQETAATPARVPGQLATERLFEEPSGIALCGLLVALGAVRFRRRRVA